MAPSRIHYLSVFNFLELMEKCQNVTINSRINGCHLNKWFHSFEHVTGRDLEFYNPLPVLLERFNFTSVYDFISK